MKKVVANLGALEEPVIAALKTALQAVRTGKRGVVAEEVGAQMVALSIAHSLAYPRRSADGLCSGGGTAWHRARRSRPSVGGRPRSLPELMGVAPGGLNNPRIHRVQEALDEASERLQEEPARWSTRGGRATASALEITEAVFEERGCVLVEWMSQGGLLRRHCCA